MKFQNSTLTLIILLTCLMSCSKSDDEIIIESAPEYPMKSLIENGDLELKYTKKNSPNTFEMGYKFKTFKSGKILALGIRVPDSDTYRVTLWNANTEEILVTTNVVSSSGLLSFEDIPPVNIESGTAYFVSVNTNDYYSFGSSGNNVGNLFPAEANNVLVLGYGSYLGTQQALPANFVEGAYLGMVDIKFVPNN
ncbi:DUF4082 domain-containing protein [Tamlana crocina]|uniref:DUF4082 domain-containing protein n=1 Tax=Tamlana crocina TaxID=393006 RepID=A0ABX1D9T7_9FLAO|nr:DUF4082 domain-containing protein [Tamlana crocina]NJX15129.1 DUF4082 domain-containing protein [Tamlana crocina]